MGRRRKRKRPYSPRLSGKRFYGIRKGALAYLGFVTYAEYLASQLWTDIRAVVLRESGHLCRCCGDTASQVHHQFYDLDDLVGNRLEYLVAVCAACHRAIEFDARGEKRTGPAAVKECRRLLRAAARLYLSQKKKAPRGA